MRGTGCFCLSPAHPLAASQWEGSILRGVRGRCGFRVASRRERREVRPAREAPALLVRVGWRRTGGRASGRRLPVPFSGLGRWLNSRAQVARGVRAGPASAGSGTCRSCPGSGACRGPDRSEQGALFCPVALQAAGIPHSPPRAGGSLRSLSSRRSSDTLPQLRFTPRRSGTPCGVAPLLLGRPLGFFFFFSPPKLVLTPVSIELTSHQQVQRGWQRKGQL